MIIAPGFRYYKSTTPIFYENVRHGMGLTFECKTRTGFYIFNSRHGINLESRPMHTES
jgi:hypothetical protein